MELLHQPEEIISKRYRIVDTLGQGGSGTTYLAEDLQTSQRVALKALSLHRMSDWKTIELFEREAQVLAQLNHPSIPRYLEYFHVDTPSDRCFYIAQELAPGKSLAAMVESGKRTSETEIKQIASQILKILIYLQSLTPPVIHRDIKPQNIILNSDGRLFIVDFGSVQNTYYNTFMRGSTVVGTYGYMAPEQFRGKAVPATDLYGLGATLLFLLTHRSPADLPTDRLKIDFRDRVQISAKLADWLEKMLEPDPQARFTSAKEALAALNGKQIKTTKKRSSTPWKTIIGTGVATVATLSVLNYYKFPLLSAVGFTPRAMYEGIMNGKIETVQYYLDRGVNPDARDYRGSSPLHWSVSNNKPDIAALLIDRGANVNAKYNEDGHTVLHIAVQHSTQEIAELLIAKGADIRARDNFGNNALHKALLKDDIHQYYGMESTSYELSKDLLELLINKGVDINARNNAGKTPMQIAGSQEIRDLLKRYGAAD